MKVPSNPHPQSLLFTTPCAVDHHSTPSQQQLLSHTHTPLLRLTSGAFAPPSAAVPAPCPPPAAASGRELICTVAEEPTPLDSHHRPAMAAMITVTPPIGSSARDRAITTTLSSSSKVEELLLLPSSSHFDGASAAFAAGAATCILPRRAVLLSGRCPNHYNTEQPRLLQEAAVEAFLRLARFVYRCLSKIDSFESFGHTLPLSHSTHSTGVCAQFSAYRPTFSCQDHHSTRRYQCDTDVSEPFNTCPWQENSCTTICLLSVQPDLTSSTLACQSQL